MSAYSEDKRHTVEGSDPLSIPKTEQSSDLSSTALSEGRDQQLDSSGLPKLNAHECSPSSMKMSSIEIADDHAPHRIEAQRVQRDAAGIAKLIAVSLHKTKSAKVRKFLEASTVDLLQPFLQVAKKNNVFPHRPGKEKCMNYMKFGNCKFGPTCKFDHPPKPKTPAESVQDTVRSKGNSVLTRAWWLCDAIGEILDKQDAGDLDEIGSIVFYALVRGFHEMTDIVLGLLSNRGAIAMELHEVRGKTYGLETHFIKIMIPQLQRHEKWEDYFYEYEYFQEFNYHAKKMSSVLGLVLEEQDAKMNSSVMHQLALPTSSNNHLVKLHQDILSYSFQQSFSMYKVAQARDQARMELQDVLHEYFGMLCNEPISITLAHFGSCANTVGTTRSDIDFLLKLTIPVSRVDSDGALTEDSEQEISHPILTSHTTFEILLHCMEALFCAADVPDDVSEEVEDALATIQAIPNFQDKLRAKEKDLRPPDNTFVSKDEERLGRVVGKFALRTFVIKARVPVLKLLHVETGVEIDVVLAETNQMAILNTQLIRNYCKQDPRVRPLLFAVKRWSSARGVSDSTNSTLSSYAWVILVIFFLLKTKDYTVDGEKGKENSDEDTDGILTNLQGIDPFGDETYGKHSTQRSLSQIYEDVLASLPVDANKQLLENEFPLKLDADVASEENEMKCAGDNCASLLLKFFAFYATECPGSLQVYDNIVSIRLAEQILKAERREKGSSNSVHIDAYEQARRRGTAMLEKAEKGAAEGSLGGTTAEDVTPVKALDPLARLIQERTSNGGNGDDSDGLTDELQDLSLTPIDNNSLTTPSSVKSSSNSSSSMKISPRPKNMPRRDSLDGTPSKNKQTPVLSSTGQIGWRFGIEDPFELEHDLGGVIRSVVGHAHIMNEMRRALNLLAFHTLPDLHPPQSSDGNVFEMLCQVCTEVPHIPFTCRICWQEGHSAIKCPFNVCRKCGGHGHYSRDCTGKSQKKKKKRDNRNNKNRGKNMDGKRNKDRR